MTKEEFESKQANVSNEQLIETIENKLSELCKTGRKSLTMNVPPHESDFDMAVCELIRRYEQLIIPTSIDANQNEDKRENGYYWVYGNKCFPIKSWAIAFWDGHSFWVDGDDFNETAFLKIDENKIDRN